MKVIREQGNQIWLAIRSIEQKNAEERKFFDPIVILYDSTSAEHHSGLLMLNSYLRKLEENPDQGISGPEILSLKKQHTRNGKIECQYCKASVPANRITIDHFIPCFFGGRTQYSNIRLSCTKCNFMKGSIHPLTMPETWKLFKRNVDEKYYNSALNILEESLTLSSLTEVERLKIMTVREKEYEWRSEKDMQPLKQVS